MQSGQFWPRGGAIGDCLFFFASGFTLFLGADRSFGNYYKRRINRIYPTVFAWAFLSCLVFGNDADMVETILHGGGWFVSCIMVYYVLIYFIRRWDFNHLRYILFFSIAVSLLSYAAFSKGCGWNMYGAGYYKWIAYFSSMLLGAIMGASSQKQGIVIRNGWLEFAKLLGGVIVFYALYAFRDVAGWTYIQALSVIPLTGVTYQMYRFCNANGMKSLYSKKVTGWIIKAIGGLCLEVYVVQFSLINDKLNFLFPLNLIIIFLVILLAAYILRCFARIWSQTFKDADYDWKQVFRI